MTVQAGAFSHHGGKERQQDRWNHAEVPGGAVGALADGMTAYEFSDVIADRAATDFVLEVAQRIQKGAEPQDALERALTLIVERCYPESRRLGDAAAVFAGFYLGDDGTAIVVGLGDVRVYGFVRDSWQELTGGVDVDPTGHPTNYLGLRPELVLPQLRRPTRRAEVSTLIALTDGTYGALQSGKRDVARALGDSIFLDQRTDDDRPPLHWAHTAVQFAVQRASQDNCSAVVLAQRTPPAATSAPGHLFWLLPIVAALAMFGAGIVLGKKLPRAPAAPPPNLQQPAPPGGAAPPPTPAVGPTGAPGGAAAAPTTAARPVAGATTSPATVAAAPTAGASGGGPTPFPALAGAAPTLAPPLTGARRPPDLPMLEEMQRQFENGLCNGRTVLLAWVPDSLSSAAVVDQEFEQDTWAEDFERLLKQARLDDKCLRGAAADCAPLRGRWMRIDDQNKWRRTRAGCLERATIEQFRFPVDKFNRWTPVVRCTREQGGAVTCWPSDGRR